jgi:hypothetical protein
MGHGLKCAWKRTDHSMKEFYFVFFAQRACNESAGHRVVHLTVHVILYKLLPRRSASTEQCTSAEGKYKLLQLQSYTYNLHELLHVCRPVSCELVSVFNYHKILNKVCSLLRISTYLVDRYQRVEIRNINFSH